MKKQVIDIREMRQPGKNIILVAHTGQGKSTFAKKLIENSPSFVFDVQNDYSDHQLKEGEKQKKGRFIGLPEDFANLALSRRKSFIVFEEATAFFEGRTSDTVRKILIDKRHKQNTIIWIFHSINSINPRIFEISDYIVLFKTGDDQTQVKRKRKEIYTLFEYLQGCENYSHIIIDNIGKRFDVSNCKWKGGKLNEL